MCKVAYPGRGESDKNKIDGSYTKFIYKKWKKKGGEL